MKGHWDSFWFNPKRQPIPGSEKILHSMGDCARDKRQKDRIVCNFAFVWNARKSRIRNFAVFCLPLNSETEIYLIPTRSLSEGGTEVGEERSQNGGERNYRCDEIQSSLAQRN